MHLNYLGYLVSNSDLEELKKEVESSKLQFSRSDREEAISANVYDFSYLLELFLREHSTELLIGAGGSALWSIISAFLKRFWKSMKKKSFFIVSRTSRTPKEPALGFSVTVNGKSKISFHFSPHLSDEENYHALETFYQNLKRFKKEESPNRNISIFFDTDDNEWKAVNPMDEILRRSHKKVKMASSRRAGIIHLPNANDPATPSSTQVSEHTEPHPQSQLSSQPATDPPAK